jgi:heterodisulfide reductase subunit C
MNALRRLAIKHNYIPTSAKTLVSNVLTHGRIYEVDDFVEEERQDLGLPALPPVDKKFMEKVSKKIASNSPTLLE